MVEWLVAKLGYSPLFRRVFPTLPRLAAEADPAVQRKVLRQAEASVYGEVGLEAYEAQGHSELQRLARRSLTQHLCQRALQGGRMVNCTRSLLSFLALLPLLGWFAVSTFRSRKPEIDRACPDLVVFFWHERLYKFVGQETFPGQAFVLHRGREARFGRRQLSFFLRALLACPGLLRYPGLLCNFARWLGYYGHVVHHYRPKRAVVHFFETVASSSLMTAYLHAQGLKHINLQHGEARFVVQSAFCYFDEIRVWSEYFRQVFRLNRSSAKEMKVVGVPYYRGLFRVRHQGQPRSPRLLIVDPFLFEDLALYSCLMKGVLQRLDAGWQVRVRRHPAEVRRVLEWMQELNADPALLARGIALEEEPPSLPIEQALAPSRVVLGVASWALIEAWIAGCKVIHLAGGPDRDGLMARYQGSPNVLYWDGNSAAQLLDRFLIQPAVRNEDEDRRVNYVVAVKEDVA